MDSTCFIAPGQNTPFAQDFSDRLLDTLSRYFESGLTYISNRATHLNFKIDLLQADSYLYQSTEGLHVSFNGQPVGSTVHFPSALGTWIDVSLDLTTLKGESGVFRFELENSNIFFFNARLAIDKIAIQ
jgi:hypothetical protein